MFFFGLSTARWAEKSTWDGIHGLEENQYIEKNLTIQLQFGNSDLKTLGGGPRRVASPKSKRSIRKRLIMEDYSTQMTGWKVHVSILEQGSICGKIFERDKYSRLFQFALEQ